MAKVSEKSVRIPSARSEDQPASRKMLSLVRDELLKKMDSGFSSLMGEIHGLKSENHEIKSGFHGLKSDIHGIKSEIHGIKSDIHGLKSEIHGLKSDIHDVKSEIRGFEGRFQSLEAGNSRMQLLLEEQNANNRIVLEGLQALWQRQDRIEQSLVR